MSWNLVSLFIFDIFGINEWDLKFKSKVNFSIVFLFVFYFLVWIKMLSFLGVGKFRLGEMKSLGWRRIFVGRLRINNKWYKVKEFILGYDGCYILNYYWFFFVVF